MIASRGRNMLIRGLKIRHLQIHPILPQFISEKVRNLSSVDKGDDQYHNPSTPPEPIPNRPLRVERPNRRNTPYSSSGEPKRSQFPQSSNVTSKNNEQESDHAFLDKFKLSKSQAPTTPPPLPHQQQVEPQKHQNQEKPPEDSDEIFKKMKETGLIPNAVAMLDGLCKDGLVQEAMKIFKLMREKGTIPEVIIYTAVVDGYCKSHKLEDAKKIFRKMQSKGILPNAYSYSILIQGLYKCNSLEDAVEFGMEMIQRGHAFNVTTFVGLVDALCKEKGVEESRRIIETLRQQGFVVDHKAVRDYLDKNAPLSTTLWEAVFGTKNPSKSF